MNNEIELIAPADKQLKNKIAMQIGFLLHSDKDVSETIQHIFEIAKDFASNLQPSDGYKDLGLQLYNDIDKYRSALKWIIHQCETNTNGQIDMVKLYELCSSALLLTSESAGPWISVKERLPEDDDQVVLFIHIHKGQIGAGNYFEKWENVKSFRKHDLEYNYTHWMPMSLPRSDNSTKAASPGISNLLVTKNLISPDVLITDFEMCKNCKEPVVKGSLNCFGKCIACDDVN